MTLWERIFGCNHDWVKDKTSGYGLINKGYYLQHYIRCDEYSDLLAYKSQFFARPIPSIGIMVYILNGEVFDGVCRKCGEVSLDFTNTQDYVRNFMAKELDLINKVAEDMDLLRTSRQQEYD